MIRMETPPLASIKGFCHAAGQRCGAPVASASSLPPSTQADSGRAIERLPISRGWKRAQSRISRGWKVGPYRHGRGWLQA
jgi:hypothetical protein